MAIKCYQVGGYVRDKILGVKSKDLDFVVEAPDYPTMLRWIQSQGKVYLEQPEYFTVRAHLPNKPAADYVLARCESNYSDGRHPDSVKAGTILDDLNRRDFTVNAIAYDEDKDLYIDPHNGINDIKQKLLRCVGNAEDRLFEDALRMLRAIRFTITKKFEMDKTLICAMNNEALAERLKMNVSEERKREELHKCFSFDTVKTLNLLLKFQPVFNACFNEESKLWLLPTMRNA